MEWVPAFFMFPKGNILRADVARECQAEGESMREK